MIAVQATITQQMTTFQNTFAALRRGMCLNGDSGGGGG
jgi:hypothetical protein